LKLLLQIEFLYPLPITEETPSNPDPKRKNSKVMILAAFCSNFWFIDMYPPNITEGESVFDSIYAAQEEARAVFLVERVRFLLRSIWKILLFVLSPNEPVQQIDDS